MISALGPAATVVAGYLGLDEHMTMLQSVGGILIVSGVLIVAAQVRKQDARKGDSNKPAPANTSSPP